MFQEEGILNLILEAIDKINVITSQGFLAALAGDQNWEMISGYLYQLLGEIFLDARRNCLTVLLFTFQLPSSKEITQIARSLPIPTD